MSTISSTSPSQLLQSISSGAASKKKSAAGRDAAGNEVISNPVSSSNFEKLAKAVTSALQSTNGSGSTDPNQLITAALTKVLQNGSLDDAGKSTDPNQANSDKDGSASSSIQASFLQTLKAAGVTPQQFQADFNDAVKAAKSGLANSASVAFKNFPIGSIVDQIG